MDAWIAGQADQIAARAVRDLEALVAISSPSGDVEGAEECVAVAGALAPASATVERRPCSTPGHAADLAHGVAGALAVARADQRAEDAEPGLRGGLAGDALVVVARDDVADLVRDHRAELVLVLRYAEDARVDADLATGQRECVGLVLLEQRDFPAGLRTGRQLAGDRVDHATHVGGLLRVAALRRLGLGLREGLGAELVEFLFGDGAHDLAATGR